jgi:hypothetical protein
VGNVTASESVEITKEGRMVGDISAPRVIIVDGASFRGRIDMGEFEVREGEKPERALARAPARPALRSRPAAPAPAAAEAAEPKAPPRPPQPPMPASLGGARKKIVIRRK